MLPFSFLFLFLQNVVQFLYFDDFSSKYLMLTFQQFIIHCQPMSILHHILLRVHNIYIINMAILFELSYIFNYSYDMKQTLQSLVYEFLMGNFAGWAAVTVGQPLDYIKVQLQTKLHLPNFRQIFQEIGPLGFYRGASSIYLFVGLISTLEFYILETATSKLCQFSNKKDIYDLSIPQLMLAGASTGFFSSFIFTPIEYAKIKSQTSKQAVPKSSVGRIIEILKQQKLSGIRKLYTGLFITIIKQSPGTAIYYGGFHSIMKTLGHKRQNASTLSQILVGSLSGVLYQFYAYPLDYLKTNVQSGEKTVKQMFKERYWTIKNFRIGLAVCLCRNSIVDATSFTVYEKLRNFGKRSGIIE